MHYTISNSHPKLDYFSSTAAQKFKDFSSTFNFQRPTLFSSTFKGLELQNNRTQALPRIFQALYEPCSADCISRRVLQVVIQEALMLLEECCSDVGIHGDDVATASSSNNREVATRFIEAVSNTTSLIRPKYINTTSSKSAPISDEQEI